MIELITYQKAKLTIDRAEETLKKCFDMLMSIKHPSEALGDSLINFQPILSDCLYELMAFYQELQTEKDYIISQKSIWVEERFKSTIKTNAKYLKVVKEVITIGKSLGDAFAWFFYAKNHQELDEHFEHPSTGLFVAELVGKVKSSL